MLRSLQFASIVSLAGLSLCHSLPHHSPKYLNLTKYNAIDRSTLDGKFFVGYQAWFRKPGQDDGNSHWTTDTPAPEVGHVGVDLLPDVTGYPAECLFDTPFTRDDGSVVQFYSNDCNGIADLHFKMMADHGISGAFMQRFYGYIGEDNGGWVKILRASKKAAEKYGRGLVIEYDITGADSTTSNITETYLQDLAALSDITSSPAYMHHEGKPVVEVWGLGINTDVTPEDGIAIITALKEAGWYVIVGVQQAWQAEMVEDKPGQYGPVYRLADMLQPWTVGSYDNSSYPSFHSGRQATDDVQALRELGIDSSIVVWPGGSNSNSNSGEPMDAVPRYNGSFYEMQLNGAVSLKPTFIFGAMFDEMNEGTSIFPVLKTQDLPNNQPFVGVDNDMAPDAYLSLAGNAAAQLAQAWQ